MENEVKTDVVVVEQQKDMAVYREPEIVLEQAKRAAKALTEVLASKKDKVIINGKQYLLFEDWQTLARFYGYSVRIVSSKPVSTNNATGYEAHAEVIDVNTGRIVSGAESMCLDDEDNWSRRPTHMLRSMAQTRACAKALRNVLAWVVVMAGFSPTPAEEMPAEARSGGSTAKSGGGDGGDMPETVPFGKNKGKKWADLPEEYLKWMVEKPFHTDWAQKELDRRSGDSAQPEMPLDDENAPMHEKQLNHLDGLFAKNYDSEFWEEFKQLHPKRLTNGLYQRFSALLEGGAEAGKIGEEIGRAMKAMGIK